MLNPRLATLSGYPFQRLRELLADIEPPAGIEPLTMSIGEPQDRPPAFLADVLSANAATWNRYPPVTCTDELGGAITGWLERRYGLSADTVRADAHVLPVVGTREALFLAVLLCTDGRTRADGKPPAVLLPNPFYQVYLGGAVMAGAEPVYLPATRETGFQPDLEAVDEETWARTAALFLCSPGNPQGASVDARYLARAIGLARTHGFVLLVDECYAEIWDKAPPAGALAVCGSEGAGFENVLVFHSLSKRSSAPGLRSGFVAGDPDLIAAFRHLRSYGGATMPMPVQAASAALWNDEDHVTVARDGYRARFDIAEAALGDHPGFHRPDGGFFLWLDVGDGEEATRRLWREAAVRVLPGAYLAADTPAGNPGASFIRIALVHPPEVIAPALARMARALG